MRSLLADGVTLAGCGMLPSLEPGRPVRRPRWRLSTSVAGASVLLLDRAAISPGQAVR